MKESTVESHLISRVDTLGGFTRKVTYQGRTKAPDRWCFFPKGLLIIFELKRPKKKPEEGQQIEMDLLRQMGQHVYHADTKERIDEILGMYF